MPGHTPAGVTAEDVWAYATRILTSLATPTDIVSRLDHTTYGLAKLSRTAMLELMEHELEFASADVLDAIAVTDATDTTEKTITVALPSGATIRRAMLIAVVVAMNNSANAQKVDVDVKGRKGAGSWSTFFSQDDCIGFGATDGATDVLPTTRDVSALVDTATSYGFKCTITQSAAQSVRYTTYYVLVVTYRMS